METSLKTQIVNAAEAVRRKVRRMRDIETNNDQVLKTVFKPITDPLKRITLFDKKTDKLTQNKIHKVFKPELDEDENMSNADNEDEYEMEHEENQEKEFEGVENNENNSTLSDDSFKTLESESSPTRNISSWSLSSEVYNDVPFGIYNEHGKLKMGSSNVEINEKFIIVANRKYKRTLGLEELLLKKTPNLTLVDQDDTRNYKQMLIDTNAHRRDYESSKPIKSNKGLKYLRIIKPLFQVQERSKASGKGIELPMIKKWKPNVDYVYWDDPNELVERLKLLIASRDAGNNGLNNEIISIVEELRESGIVNK